MTKSAPWNYEHLDVQVTEQVLVARLNRPAALNAVHPAMHHELASLFARIAGDDPLDDVAAVIITGAGRAFCAGGDIKNPMPRAGRGDDANWHPLRGLATGSDLIRNLLAITQPVIAAVNGDAVGLGATLALCSDIVMAAPEARLGDPHVLRGLVAGDGGAVIWPLLCGPNIAKEYLMTGDLLPSEEAHRLGLVNRIVAGDDLMEAATALARRLADGHAPAIRWTKQSVNKVVLERMNLILDTSLALERITMLARPTAAGN